MAKLSIIIPCYYNELNIPITSSELLANEINFPEGTNFEYVMIDDGSKDETFNKLIEFKNANPNKVKIIKLSGNFGSYNAILAGMANATGDCNVIISADLQDPISIMPKMFDYWIGGVKLVIGNRQNRKDPFFSKIFASFFQFLIRKFAIKNLPKGGFDYVLFDKQLKDQVISIDDKNSNSLYLLMWLKYDYVSIPYTRQDRKHGKSKWTFSKKMKLLIDTFVAFSFMPIRAISISGIFLGICALIYALVIMYQKITDNISVEGWSATMLVFLFVSSFQMISLGILGEYLYRTLDASRNRPNFIIDEIIE
jgi:glycosyltransferase involved in cell wall biosynthesis